MNPLDACRTPGCPNYIGPQFPECPRCECIRLQRLSAQSDRLGALGMFASSVVGIAVGLVLVVWVIAGR